MSTESADFDLAISSKRQQHQIRIADWLLSCEDVDLKHSVLMALEDAAVPHTEIVDALQNILGLTTSEAAVRRWRKAHNVKR